MKKIIEELVSFQTTHDKPDEIKKALDYVASLFSSNSFEVRNFEHNGVYSQLISLRGNDALSPDILLNGHIDVVPGGSYEITEDDDSIYGRGVADMKGPIASLIQVMQEAATKNPSPNVALLITGDEEVGGENGAGYVARETGLSPKFVVCADGGATKRMVLTVKEKGGLWLELKAKGMSGHGAYPWEGINAINKVIAAIEKIKAYVGPAYPKEWTTTVNVGTIETSNTSPNIIPDDARAVLDIRFTEDWAKTPEELLENIKGIVSEVEVNALLKVPPMFGDEEDRHVQRFKDVAEEVIEEKLPFENEHGATDARYFADKATCVIFGIIGGDLHGENEWADKKSLEHHKETISRFVNSFKS